MATSTSRSIFGSLSGSAGKVVYSSWKGIGYSRSKPVRVANPRTPGQLVQRAKLKVIIAFLQPLTLFLRIGFKGRTAKMSAYNAAMSYHLKNAITGKYPNYGIDYSKAMVSQGSLPGAKNPTVTSPLAGQLEFTWEDEWMESVSRPDDKVMLVVYNPVRQEAVTLVGGNTRQTGRQVITIPSSFHGEEVQCYIAFLNEVEKLVSDSRYLGAVAVKGEGERK
ncbi:MAG TPA: DUF6266 family protein [Prolixibacteraceae bacterium]|jgi:hypothetical protein